MAGRVLTTGIVFLFTGLVTSADDQGTTKEKLDKAKAAYEAQAKQCQDAVLDALNDVEIRAKAENNQKLIQRVATEREQFAKYGTAPKVANVRSHMQRLDSAQREMVEAYQAAIRQYRAKNLKAEVELVTEELVAFRDRAAGRPDWCRAVAQGLAGKIPVTHAGGSGREYTLAQLQRAFATDPAFGIRVKGAKDLANRALGAVVQLDAALKNSKAKGAELDSLLENAKRETDVAGGRIGNETARAAFQALRERLEYSGPKGK